MSDTPETPGEASKFDPSTYSPDTFFYDRRDGDRRAGIERRAPRPAPADGTGGERRQKKERRRRVDPTTFEKQYSADELEFMAAMQEFKVRTTKAFPTYAEVLAVAKSLGYSRPSPDVEGEGPTEADRPIALPFPTTETNGTSH
jgi:hypothetical protein